MPMTKSRSITSPPASGGGIELELCFMDEEPVTTLSESLQHYGIEIPVEQVQHLDRYCQLLWEWNTRLNLTRHTDYDKFVGRDLADVMALSSLLESGEKVLDFGTGGGVPGVPLAILRPDVQVSLAESVAKKAKAVDTIVSELGLPVPVYHARAEDVLDDFRFTTLVARAVGSMAKVLRWCAPHWASIGRLLLVKGPRWVEERSEARRLGLLHNLELRRAASYPLPNTDSESVILEVKPKPG